MFEAKVSGTLAVLGFFYGPLSVTVVVGTRNYGTMAFWYSEAPTSRATPKPAPTPIE